MQEREKRIRWIGWIYAVILVMVAVAGIIYCSKLNSASDAANSPMYYAVEQNGSEDTGVLSENADAGDPDATDDADIVDMGDISTDVPLGDVTEE